MQVCGGCKVIAACNTDQYTPPSLESRLLVLMVEALYTRRVYRYSSTCFNQERGWAQEALGYTARRMLGLGSRGLRGAVKHSGPAALREDVEKLVSILKTCG